MTDLFCPVHKELVADIKEIRATQTARHCQSHEAQLHTLNRDDEELKEENKNQWIAINQLRRMVYLGAGGVGAAAFFGSILGNLLISYFKH